MKGSTGPGGRILILTGDGTLYSIPEHWGPLPMPRLDELADFLKPAPYIDPAPWLAILRAIVDAEDDNERDRLRSLHPREAIALHHWQRLTPLVPVRDAHGPTFRQLLDAINEAHQ